ncbi:hypothetical protein BEP19_05665 [Ammoniphilus oxalaticus]|uniref:LysM domain-containing protein n=1 Tax=Ammoniphilus oxalaticus TaxID=66863 RepID=A0A419SIQ2_9BACL|nr:LysM domain-containing protein [Ammoniphilus oxalaticus]RKD23914.1 hypothetical protein BEP19_05665 [Ammoniphilus oxalaticus]
MRIHIVKRGETLAKIAKRYNVPLERLREINQHLKDPEKLTAGAKVKVPTAGIRLKTKQVVPVSKQAKQDVELVNVQQSFESMDPLESSSVRPITPSVMEQPLMPEAQSSFDFSSSDDGTRQFNPTVGYPYQGVPTMFDPYLYPPQAWQGYGPYTSGVTMQPADAPYSPYAFGSGFQPSYQAPYSFYPPYEYGCNSCQPPMPYGPSGYYEHTYPGTTFGSDAGYLTPWQTHAYGGGVPFPSQTQSLAHGPYDSDFFTRPYYPTLYHEGHYMREAGAPFQSDLDYASGSPDLEPIDREDESSSV